LAKLESAGVVEIATEGGPVSLDSQDLQIRLQAKPGWAAAHGPAAVVVLATELDESLIADTIAYAKAQKIPASRYEFQMLYGLRKSRWEELVRDGYNVRIYVPFGTHWIPYFYRRLRERRENVLFVLRNLFR